MYDGFESTPWEYELEHKQFEDKLEVECLEIHFPKHYVELCLKNRHEKSPVINSVAETGLIRHDLKDTVLLVIDKLKSEIGYHVNRLRTLRGPDQRIFGENLYHYECFLDMMGFILEEKRKIESLTA